MEVEQLAKELCVAIGRNWDTLDIAHHRASGTRDFYRKQAAHLLGKFTITPRTTCAASPEDVAEAARRGYIS